MRKIKYKNKKVDEMALYTDKVVVNNSCAKSSVSKKERIGWWGKVDPNNINIGS